MAYDFQKVEKQAAELKLYEQRFMLSPDQWVGFNSLVNLVWTDIPFGTGNEVLIPEGVKGVYTFVLCPGIASHNKCSYLLYVGSTAKQDFRIRFKQYLNERDTTARPRRIHITHMLNKWDGYLHFCYAPIEDNATIATMETRLQVAYIPPIIRAYPTEIRDAMAVLR